MPHVLYIFSDVNASGLGALGINTQSFIIQIITFVIVFLVLKKFAFKPILKIMKERKELIENGVKLGEEMKKKSVELESEIAEKLTKARTDADKIISSAQQQAREVVVSAEETAKQKTEQIAADAQDRIKRDTASARKQLEAELVGLISEATEAIIDEKIDAKKDANLIDKALHQKERFMKQPRSKISSYIASKSLKSGVSKSLGKQIAAYLIAENRTSELNSILRDVMQDWADEGVVEVITISAFDISSKVEADIKKEINKLYPNVKQIIITKQHDPSVVAGIRLELANQQLDLSVEAKLNKFKQLSVAERNN